ncbi:hypothetical protein DH2020_024929 [Rehmannia glutinosa]|uniref:Uncharacterized protein n=1 Tax=Rehmannia glutinosa TaxID=99300 RepID=A0ABR0W3W9_REHGL
MVEAKNKESSHWWWFDSHNKGNSNRSPWLQSTLADWLFDRWRSIFLNFVMKTQIPSRNAQKCTTRNDRADQHGRRFLSHAPFASRALRSIQTETRLITPWSSPLPFTKYRLEKSLSLSDKAYDSYSDEAYGPEEESDESEVDDPEEEEQKEVTLQNPVEYDTEEVLRLRQELERLREENKVQKDEIMRKDEEKREVIRQLSLGMDLLRDENLKLRQFIAKNNTPKKENRVEYNKLKDGFLGRLFDGFGKSSANLVAL